MTNVLFLGLGIQLQSPPRRDASNSWLHRWTSAHTPGKELALKATMPNRTSEKLLVSANKRQVLFSLSKLSLIFKLAVTKLEGWRHCAPKISQSRLFTYSNTRHFLTQLMFVNFVNRAKLRNFVFTKGFFIHMLIYGRPHVTKINI